jgi:hypothetical protein
MDYQTKLDNLHREIVFALCSIREFPEGLLPFCVHVEEETEESLECGHSEYNRYNLTEVYPDGRCLLEDPDTGIEEERELQKICIDSLAELWNAYRYLSGEETSSRVICLLQAMEPIAKSLITGQFITDFTVHDSNFIRKTNAKTPFIWFVYKSGTHIYSMDKNQEIQNMKSTLDHYENDSESNFCLYLYDGKKLFPVFPKAIRGWIEEQLKIEN